MKISSPLLSSPKPLLSQAKVAPPSNADHARTGYLFHNGERIFNASTFLEKITPTFEHLWEGSGTAKCESLIEHCLGNEKEDLISRTVPKDRSCELPSSLADVWGDAFVYRNPKNNLQLLLSENVLSSTPPEELEIYQRNMSEADYKEMIDLFKAENAREIEEFPQTVTHILNGNIEALQKIPNCILR